MAELLQYETSSTVGKIRTMGGFNAPWNEIKTSGECVQDPDFSSGTYTQTKRVTKEGMWTEGAERCLVIAVLGLAENHDAWGFMFHTDPSVFKYEHSEFVTEYNYYLSELHEKTIESSLISIIAGGRNNGFTGEEPLYMADNRINAIEELNSIYGIATVTIPFLEEEGLTHVYVDTPRQKVIILETDKP